MVSWDLGVVFIRFAVTASPLVECTAVDLSPAQQIA